MRPTFEIRDSWAATIWRFAGTNDYMIVTKDADFNHRTLLLGSPPKVVWIRLGNRSPGDLVDLLEAARARLEEFRNDPEAAVLLLG